MRKYFLLLSILLCPLLARAVSFEVTRDVTIPAWSTESVYSDNTVYEMNLTSSQIEAIQNSATSNDQVGGAFFEPFSAVPSPGDKRCLDNNCDYYLDISEIHIKILHRAGKMVSYDGPWGNGGYKGTSTGWGGAWGPTSRGFWVLSDSKIKIKKRHTGGSATPPAQGKTVTISVAQCENPQAWFDPAKCNSLNPGYPGVKLNLNINVPAPTLPKVQCYMSPWSNNIDFQPVTVPVETGRAGAVTWPLSGGTFTGVEKQSSSLSIQCNNIAADVSTLPLKVSLKGNGWEYGNNGELFFGTERNIAVATALKMSANTGSLALDNDGSGCDAYWKNTGNNNFEMGALSTGNYLMNGGNQCSFTHQLPAPHSVMEEFRFTVDAILGVSTATAAKTPEYRKHQGALMLEVSMH